MATASDIKAGTEFQYGSWTYTATKVEVLDGIIAVELANRVFGSMLFYPDSEVTIIPQPAVAAVETQYYPEYSEYMLDEMRKAESRLQTLATWPESDDRQWRELMFINTDGRRVRRNYRTEAGFLKGWLKAVREHGDVLLAE